MRQRDISDGNLYVAHMRLAQHDWEQGQIGRLHDMLDSHIPQPGRPDLRGWEWYYYLSLCHKDLMTLRGDISRFNSVAWSGDGHRLASVRPTWDDRDLERRHGREILKFSARQSPLNSVAWSPDGKRLASGSRTDGQNLDAATGRRFSSFADSTVGFARSRGARTVSIWRSGDAGSIP